MKIAFDLRRIKNPGIGRYMTCLVEAVIARASEHEYLLILPPGTETTGPCLGRRVEREISSASCYSFREQLELPRILRRHQVDLLHSPHFNLPLFSPCPAVVTIHDVIYLACKQDLPSRLGRLYYRGMMFAAVRLADRVVTDSEFSKRDIVRCLRADPAKIEVIYPAVPPGFERVRPDERIREVLDGYGIDAEYILYAGIYKPRKNHAGLLRAFREFLEGRGDAKLVIAGPLGDGEAVLRGLARELGVESNVILTGFVPDSDLAALYSGARVYACPSLYEGFGFTVLEAMACGVPVVCSEKTSLPEVAAGAAQYADSANPKDFAAALTLAFDDPAVRGDLIARGNLNLIRFSWESAADRVLVAYRRAAGLAVKNAVWA